MPTKDPVEVVVWSDFVCPWCFLADTALERVSQEVPLRVEWRAYELRPGGGVFDAAKMAMIKSSFPRLQQIARDNGVELPAVPRLGLDTRAAHEGSKFFAARLPARQTEYQRAIFRAHHVGGEAIDDVEVLVAHAVACGADAAEFRAALADGTYRDSVIDDERAAAQLGITGVPAQVVAGHRLPSGFHPAAQLREAIDAIRAQDTQGR